MSWLDDFLAAELADPPAETCELSYYRHWYHDGPPVTCEPCLERERARNGAWRAANPERSAELRRQSAARTRERHG